MTSTAVAQVDEKRVALIIGNADYAAAPLKNPVNDARLIGNKLRQLGFEVTVLENGTRQAMGSAIAAFIHKLEPGGVSLIYYAGHGIQARGRNYMIPTDAKLGSEADLRFQAVDIGSVTEELEQAQNRVGLLILDACRHNPFERRMRGGARGLSAIDAARGTLIAYATAPGSVAEDGEGNNGTYADELVKALDVPNLKAEEVFKRVTAGVEDRTKGAQTPWVSSSLRGDFIFNLTIKVSPVVSVDRETVFWQSAQSSNRTEEYWAYLNAYPTGVFAELARSRIATLENAAKPPQVAAAPTTSALQYKPDISVEPIDREFTATQMARLRQAPDIKSQQVGLLKEGDRLLVLGKVSGKPWYQVERKGEAPAYISTSLVEETGVYAKRKEEQAARVADGAKRQQQTLGQTPLQSAPGQPAAGQAMNSPQEELPLMLLRKMGVWGNALGLPRVISDAKYDDPYTFQIDRAGVKASVRAWLAAGTLTVQKIEFSTLKFGGTDGTDVQAQFTRQNDDSWKLELVGERLNLEPYIDVPELLSTFRLSVNAQVRRLRLDSKRTLNDVRMFAAFGGKYWDTIDIDSLMDNRSELKLRYRPVGEKRDLFLYATDAGSVLQMLTAAPLARDLRGGEIAIKATHEPSAQGAPIEGLLQMRGFSLRDTPSGNRVISVLSDLNLPNKPKAAGEDLNFSRLEASFRKAAERFELQSLMALSRGLGINASGGFDLGANSIDIVGHVAPFRMIGQLLDENPWVGASLGEVDKQGLVGFPFTGTGPVSEPIFQVDKKPQPLPAGQMREFARLATGKDRDLSAGARLKPPGMTR